MDKTKVILEPAAIPPEPTEEETLAIAVRLHGDQTDWGGRPYREHLEAVHANLGPDASEIERKAAYLHDTVEDCLNPDTGLPLTAHDLLVLGFRQEIVDIVVLLTLPASSVKPEHNLPREEAWALAEENYIAKIEALIAHGNVSAMRVKRADNKHNADPTRDRYLSPKQRERSARFRRRYQRSIDMLDRAIALHENPGVSRSL